MYYSMLFTTFIQLNSRAVRKIALFLCGCFSVLAVAAQPPEPRHYNFTHYTEENGLLSYQVNATLQDEDGYIWIATNEGLQRFDGVRFRNFFTGHPPHPQLSSPRIQQILLHQGNNLWILTAEGSIGIFNTKAFTFSAVTIRLNNTGKQALLAAEKKLVADAAGNIFLLLPGEGVLSYHAELNEFSTSHNSIGLTPGVTIQDLVPQPGTPFYWIVSEGNGISIFDCEKGSMISANNIPGAASWLSHLRDRQPSMLYFDKKGRLWYVLQQDGMPYVHLYDLGQQRSVLDAYGFREMVQRSHNVRIFLEQEDGTIWISGTNILARYMEEEQEFEPVYNGYANERSIDFVIIPDLTEDREHNIWICTANNGLYRFNPSEEYFRNIDFPARLTGNIGSGAPLAFLGDLDNSILVGVWGDGLYRYDSLFNRIPLDIVGIPSDSIIPVVSMCRSPSSSKIWIGMTEGLYAYDQVLKKAVHYPLPDLPSRIREVYEDNHGVLWLGLQDHGLYFARAELPPLEFARTLKPLASVPECKIQGIMGDKHGNMWVSSMQEGLFVINPLSGQHIMHFHEEGAHNKRLPEQNVVAALDYNDSLVFIGSRNRLLKYNRNKDSLSVFSENISGYLQSMQRDQQGDIWLSTTTGLQRLSVRSGFSVRFNRNDGILNDYFMMAASRALPDGRMLFGASLTMVAFNPAEIRIDTLAPKIQIADFKVLNKSLRVDSLLQLPVVEFAPDEHSFTIDLTTLSYLTDYQLRYQLQGIDNEWKNAGRNKQLVYSYLPPGEYTLNVSTLNARGSEGTPLTFNFSIAAPFWKQWWFYGMLFLLVIFLFFWFDKERMQKRETLFRMRSAIAIKLHEEVSSALHNINILSEMAQMKAEKEPRKSAEFIQQIHSKSHKMIIAMDDMLWSIAPENDNMERTIARIREYTHSLNNRHAAHIELLVDPKVNSLKMEMQLRYESFLLFKDIIRGLVFAGAKDCNMHLTSDRYNLICGIEFDRGGTDKTLLYGIEHGQDVVKRVKAINAKMCVTDHKTHSRLEVLIPLTSQPLNETK